MVTNSKPLAEAGDKKDRLSIMSLQSNFQDIVLMVLRDKQFFDCLALARPCWPTPRLTHFVATI